MTTNTKSRAMTSSKPCRLTPNQRAYAMQILNTQVDRKRYNTRYMEVQKSENYRVKLDGFRGGLNDASIVTATRLLREAGYIVEVRHPTGMGMGGGWQRRTDRSAIVFMFTGVKRRNTIKFLPGYSQSGDYAGEPKAKKLAKKRPSRIRQRAAKAKKLAESAVLKLGPSAGKRVIKIAKPAKTKDEIGMLIEPNRNLRKNNGLPADVKPNQIEPMAVVLVQWVDAKPSLVLVTSVDRPRDRKTNRFLRSGEISYRGFSTAGGEVHFTSTQILSIHRMARTVLAETLQEDDDLADMSQVFRIHERMQSRNWTVAVTQTRGSHDVLDEANEVDDMDEETFAMLRKMPNVVEKLVLYPGQSPIRVLCHSENESAAEYEVTLAYKNRPNVPVSLRGVE